MKLLFLHIKIFWAFITNNYGGLRRDVHGRSYRKAYKRFGHLKMITEYLTENSWRI